MARHETRKVGDGGEVVIPKDFRDDHGIKPGDEVEFEDRGREGIVLRPAREAGARARNR